MADQKIDIKILAVNQASSEVKKVSDSLKELKSSLNTADEAGGSVSKNIASGFQAAIGSKLLDVLSGSINFAVDKLKEFVVASVQTVVETEKITTSFKTLTGSAAEANEILNQIRKDAKATPFELNGLAKAQQLIQTVTKDSDKARKIVLALGDAVAASGGGNDELMRMAQNLQQIGNVGKATAMDIKQFAYAGIDIYGILKDVGMEGQQSFEAISTALMSANQEGGRFYDAMNAQSQTLAGQWERLGDTIKLGGAEILNATGGTNFLKDSLTMLSDVFEDLQEKITTTASNTNFLDDAQRAVAESVQASSAMWGELTDKRDKDIRMTAGQIDYAGLLVEKLRGMTDSQGKVKSGYEDEASALTKLINDIYPDAISTREEMSGMYLTEKANLDKLLTSKKAEALLESNQETYKNAIANMDMEIAKLGELALSRENVAAKMQGVTDTTSQYYQQLKGEYDQLTAQYTTASQTVDGMQASITLNNSLMKASTEGDVAAMDAAWEEFNLRNSTRGMNELARITTENEQKRALLYGYEEATKNDWLLADEQKHALLVESYNKSQIETQTGIQAIRDTVNLGAYNTQFDYQLQLRKMPIATYDEMVKSKNTAETETQSIAMLVKNNASLAQQNYKTEIDKMAPATKEGMVATAYEIVNAKPAFSQGGHDVGYEANRGAAQGIEDGKSSVLNTIASWASGIIQSAKDALGIHSPSTIFAEIGDFSAQGFAEGLTAGIKRIDVSSIMSDVVPEIRYLVGSDGAGASNNNYDQSSTINISGVNINEPVDLDLFGQALAATIQNRIY